MVSANILTKPWSPCWLLPSILLGLSVVAWPLVYSPMLFSGGLMSPACPQALQQSPEIPSLAWKPADCIDTPGKSRIFCKVYPVESRHLYSVRIHFRRLVWGLWAHSCCSRCMTAWGKTNLHRTASDFVCDCCDETSLSKSLPMFSLGATSVQRPSPWALAWAAIQLCCSHVCVYTCALSTYAQICTLTCGLLTTNALAWELPPAASLSLSCPFAGSTCPADPSIFCSSQPSGSSQPALPPDSTQTLNHDMDIIVCLYIIVYL